MQDNEIQNKKKLLILLKCGPKKLAILLTLLECMYISHKLFQHFVLKSFKVGVSESQTSVYLQLEYST